MTTDLRREVTNREIADLSCEYWAEQAWQTPAQKDKAMMYDLAARAIEKYDEHHANVLRRLANRYKEGSNK
jgi:hypothetical protein